MPAWASDDDHRLPAESWIFMAIIALENVSKKYGQVTALAPLDLTFDAGRIYVLLGTSGCGKSTLLKLMLGLVSADSGTVRIAGEVLCPANMLELRRRIGYVIQHAGLFPHLTASQNVSLVARQLKWAGPRIEERLCELAELVQLPRAELERFSSQLSGGQQQRVGLMRALMLDPDVLLMDEPLGALDPIIRADLQADLRSIFRRLNKTVVIVTHDVHEAAFFADEILLLRAGQLVQRGSLSELLKNPADPFVTEFINAQRHTLGDGPDDAPAGGAA